MIWYAERVARWFPDAKFVAVERSVFGTVASMLRHPGVLQWQQDWKRYGVPNRFLGIGDEATAAAYEAMAPEERAALRWSSHRSRTEELRSLLGDRLLVLDYEPMVDDYEHQLARLWDFLALPAVSVASQEPKRSSRDGWREQLTSDQVERISRVTGIDPPGA